MDYWSTNFYKANNERAAAILDKVKKDVWLFLKDEDVVRKDNCFLHKFGVLSWEAVIRILHLFLQKLEKKKPF